MGTGSSGLMQPLWAPQPNIYNSGITRGGEQKLVGIQMVLLRLIGAATKLLTTYTRPPRAVWGITKIHHTRNTSYEIWEIGQDLKGRDNKDTSNKEIEFKWSPIFRSRWCCWLNQFNVESCEEGKGSKEDHECFQFTKNKHDLKTVSSIESAE